jgi:hypothetical protein
MSKKILTVLAPVAAIAAFMVVPAMAQATVMDQVQCGSVECANGAALKGQSSNLVTKTQSPSGELKCTSSTFEGTLAEAQSDVEVESNVQEVQGQITLDKLTGCTANGVPADVSTNATAAHPWHLQVQVNHTTKKITAHIKPNAQQTTIQFTVQVQVFGFSAATCTYGASSIQLSSEVQSDVSTIEQEEKEGAKVPQFTLEASNSSECGTVGTTKGHLTGSTQLENGAGEAVVVHSV